MKITLIIVGITAICLLVFTTISWAANKKVERQRYKVIKQEQDFEVRFYPRAIMASVSSSRTGDENDGNQNFRRLAGYIFGGNKQEQKIPMTAPVYMESDSADNKMSFVLPANYQITDLPNPNDPNIELHYSDEGYYACLSFGGFAGAKRIKEKENELASALQKNGYKVIGKYKYLGYNAPWDLINRENDIIVKIEYTKK
jgi:hypothetical protein